MRKDDYVALVRNKDGSLSVVSVADIDTVKTEFQGEPCTLNFTHQAWRIHTKEGEVRRTPIGSFIPHEAEHESVLGVIWIHKLEQLDTMAKYAQECGRLQDEKIRLEQLTHFR